VEEEGGQEEEGGEEDGVAEEEQEGVKQLVWLMGGRRP
jgi:hypothetical protein